MAEKLKETWPSRVGFPSIGKKKRLSFPIVEMRTFIEKNKISETPKIFVFVVNDTADGLWGMTDEMFKLIATAVRRESRGFIKFLYRNPFPLKIKFDAKQNRFSPLTKMEKHGLINFGEGERFHVVCSCHEDYSGAGYFLRFTPAQLTTDGRIKYPDFKERASKILGSDLLEFLAKMQV